MSCSKDTLPSSFTGLSPPEQLTPPEETSLSPHSKVASTPGLISHLGDVAENTACNTCNYTFTDRNDQVLHYKLDWHLYNVKQALRIGYGGPISEQEFSEQCEGDDLSSLSGSDDDNDGDNDVVTSTFIETSPQLTGAVVSRPYIVFQSGDCFYKCLYSLLFSSQTVVTDTALHETLGSCTSAEPTTDGTSFRGRVGVFLYTAQHFAGAVYEGDTLLLHKTYHRYTVRAKQGTAQGIRDGKGNAPKSFGASLRRYNQIALFNDIEKLLLDWSDTLNGCHAVFYRTAVNNRNVFDKIKEKVDDKKHKFRSIPFTTYRPTLKETARVHKLLVKITKTFKKEFDDIKEAKTVIENSENVGHNEPNYSSVQISKPNSIPNSHLKHRAPKQKSERDIIITETDSLVEQVLFFELPDNIYYKITEAIKNRDFKLFVSLLNSDSSLNLHQKLKDDYSLLHCAALSTDSTFVKELLSRSSNPELKSKQNKTAYETASGKETRDEFRRFMALNPNKWDYKAAKIPSPLTPGMEEEQANKKQEKKKAQRAAKAQRDKQKKAAAREAAKREEEKLVEEVQQLRSRQLTARERCLLAAEARLAAESKGRGSVSGKCDGCGTGLDGLVPFERVQYKYCSVTCVREHKEVLGG